MKNNSCLRKREYDITAYHPDLMMTMAYLQTIFLEVTTHRLGIAGKDLPILSQLSWRYQPEGVMALWDVWMKRDGLRPRFTPEVKYPILAFYWSVDILVDGPEWRPLREGHRPKPVMSAVHATQALLDKWIPKVVFEPKSRIEWLIENKRESYA